MEVIFADTDGMAKQYGRKPDYNLAYLNKNTEARGEIGCAWANDDGSISIRLNPLVVLPADPNRELVLTLFPRDSNHKGHQDDQGNGE